MIVIFFFPETKGKTLEEMVRLSLRGFVSELTVAVQDEVFGDQVIPHALDAPHYNEKSSDEKIERA